MLHWWILFHESCLRESSLRSLPTRMNADAKVLALKPELKNININYFGKKKVLVKTSEVFFLTFLVDCFIYVYNLPSLNACKNLEQFVAGFRKLSRAIVWCQTDRAEILHLR